MFAGVCSHVDYFNVRTAKFDNFATLLKCTPRPKAIHFSWLESEFFCVCCLVNRGSTDELGKDFQWYCLTSQGSPAVTQYVVYVESSSLLHGIKP